MSRFLNIALGLSVATILVIAQAPQSGAPAPAPGFALGASGGRGGSGRGGNPLRDPHTEGYVTAKELPDNTIPTPKEDGNFIIGPTHPAAQEITNQDGVPQGEIINFTMESTDSKYYPGVPARLGRGGGRGAFGASGAVAGGPPPAAAPPALPPASSADAPRPIVPYTRKVAVYVPKQYIPGTVAPFIVGADGPDPTMFAALNTLIAQKRVPVMICISIGNGGGDGPGSERGLEYDTMSPRYAEFVENEVLPLVEQKANVKLTKDPEGRATTGGSSGGSAALIMAWYHPELYHRVLTYSGTFVGQESPVSTVTPHGAWELHGSLIPNSPVKPIRLWMEVGDRDNGGRDVYHDWVVANENMAKVLAEKGYHYQFLFSKNAGHVDRATRMQTLPLALEYVWQGYPIRK